LTNTQDELLCCDCLLIPIPDGRVLFVAERIVDDPAMAKIVQRLNRRVKLFRLESEQAKKIAVKKQVEIESVLAQADEVSNTDALTFLSNRRQIIRELQNEIQRAERYKSQLSISMLDVDHFKNINDTYGHDVGDLVLREIAKQLRDHIRVADMVGRYGGEEFLILLPNTLVEDAAEQALRLCGYVREAQICVNEKIVRVTISIGVAQFRHGTDTWHTLLSRADTAMYAAKQAGRDQWAVSKN
jgi:diguanylate cyclase (GGDEF)-like protein